jgi:hypothetical protein
MWGFARLPILMAASVTYRCDIRRHIQKFGRKNRLGLRGHLQARLQQMHETAPAGLFHFPRGVEPQQTCFRVICWIVL